MQSIQDTAPLPYVPWNEAQESRKQADELLHALLPKIAADEIRSTGRMIPRAINSLNSSGQIQSRVCCVTSISMEWAVPNISSPTPLAWETRCPLWVKS